MKDVNGDAFENAYGILQFIISSLCVEHAYLGSSIPNEEVKTIFAETVAKWFSDTVTDMDRRELFHAWWNGEDENLTEMVTDILFNTISYYDYKENYYHAFVVGLFTDAGYAVTSNQEQGTGRADVIVKDQRNRRAMIIEIKRSQTEEAMRKDCFKALEQIEREQYARNFLKGYRTVLCYGAAFFEKECLIRKAEKQEESTDERNVV